uniref:Uncharacterized protein n=1 Tax=Arundo donax TaxID=35708 RepID=A0A0A9H0J4_ARUDO
MTTTFCTAGAASSTATTSVHGGSSTRSIEHHTILAPRATPGINPEGASSIFGIQGRPPPLFPHLVLACILPERSDRRALSIWTLGARSGGEQCDLDL